jgi:hypothetical protein
MGRKVEVDLFEIMSLWMSVEYMGIHKSDFSKFLPKPITDDIVEEYIIEMMPKSAGYGEEDFNHVREVVAEHNRFWKEYNRNV